MKRFVLIATLLSLSFAPSKKKLDKAFEALAIYDYFKAKNLFEKTLEKEPVASAYGLGKIYYEERNHFFHLDSSEKYLNYAINYFKIVNEKDRLKLTRWNVDSMQLAIAKDDLANKIFSRYLDRKNQASVESFLNRFPDFSDRKEVIDLRNNLAFAKAKNDGSLFALRSFMDNYPNAKEVSKAQELYDRIQFEQNTSAGTEEDLVKFINEHPESPYLRHSQDKLYDIYQSKDRFEDYQLFMQTYPENPNFMDAAEQLIELALYDFNLESLVKLTSKFPRIKSLNKYQKYVQFFHQLNEETRFRKGELYENTEEGFRTVFLEEKVNFINPLFEEVSNEYFEDALGFSQGLCVVFNEGKYGLIDRRGKFILPIIYDEIGEFSSGLIMGYRGEEYLYFDKYGEERLSIDVLPVGDFKDSFLLIKDGEGYGMIDREKNYILEPNFEWLEHFNKDSIARFRINGKYGLINVKRDTLINPDFDFISLPNEGIRFLEKEGELQFLNDTKFSDTFDVHDRKSSQFRNGYSVVSIKTKFGIIDSNFNEVLPLKYSEIRNLGNGHFSIKEKNKFKYFNAQTAKIGKTTYSELRSGNKQHLIFKNQDFVGLIDRFENVIFKKEKSNLNVMGSYFTIENEEGKFGLLDQMGLEIIKTEFERIEKLSINSFKLKKEAKTIIYNTETREEILLN